MENHARFEELEAFARGELATEEVRKVITHLLSGCAACKALISRAFRHGLKDRSPGPGETGGDAVADAQRRAYTLLGKAYRLARRWGEDAEALGMAEELASPDIGDERTRAWLSDLQALLEADRLNEALAQVAAGRAMWPEGSLHQIKLQWIAARIHLEKGELTRAERLLLTARDEFIRRELFYRAATVSLDLAAVELKRSRADLAQPLIEEALRAFTVLRLPPEALGALVLLRRAVKDGVLCAALVQRIGERLRKAGGD